MNKIYRLVWDPVLSGFRVVSELAKSKGKHVGLSVAGVVACSIIGMNVALADAQLLDGTKVVIELKSGTSGNATTAGSGSIAIGGGSSATGVSGGDFSAIALGVSSKATGQAALAIGESSSATGNRSIAIGNSSNINGVNSVALGANAAITVNNALALGDKTTVSLANSVALGAGSTATAVSSTAANGTANAIVAGKTLTVTQAPTNGVVAVGNRQIQGVADGALTAASRDTVNGSQLFSVARALNANTSALGARAASALRGGVAYDATTGVWKAPSYSVQGTAYGNVGGAIGAVDSSLTALGDSITAGTTGVVQRTAGVGADGGGRNGRDAGESAAADEPGGGGAVGHVDGRSQWQSVKIGR
ncbi:Hep_Hag [Serratia liquefaciens]|nr:Hep_Hag [Serratia liquefaciens]